jgi:hypothetical protein
MVEFTQQGSIIMSEMYCETLKELCRAIHIKSHGMLISGVMLLNNNECLHTAANTTALLEYFIWELFDRIP